LNKIQLFGKVNGIHVDSNHHAFYNLVERVIHDPELRKRHPGPAKIVKVISILNLHFFAKLISKRFQPVMDVEASF
jgi:hypothetical protein